MADAIFPSQAFPLRGRCHGFAVTDEVFCLRVVEDARPYKHPPCQIESVGVGALDDPLPNMLFAQ